MYLFDSLNINLCDIVYLMSQLLVCPLVETLYSEIWKSSFNLNSTLNEY